MTTCNTFFTRRQAVCAVALAVAGFNGVAFGQSADKWPEKPIRIVVGAPAGGSADILARAVGDGLSKALGQPVVVDNKPGAMGGIATDALFSAPRDGYTYMMAVNSLVSEIPYTIKPKYDPFKELVPLVEIVNSPLVLITNPALGVSSLKEMVAYVKANPGKTSFASYSAGTLSHVMGLQLNKAAGLDMQHIGYKGSPPAVQDVMAGQVQFMFDGAATSIPGIKGSKLKALAVTSTLRSPVLPDVPTMAELGYPAMTQFPWIALWTTPDAPAAIQSKMRAEVIKVLADTALRQKFANFGLEVDPKSPTVVEMQQTLRKEHQTVGALLNSINYKPE
jgi:tripartite-type tricarboxylate transporter receptor subunit TctC